MKVLLTIFRVLRHMFINWKNNTFHFNYHEYHLNMSENGLGPFSVSDQELKQYLYDTRSIMIEYKFMNIIPDEATPNFQCYLWSLTQQINFADRSHMQVILNKHRSICESSANASLRNYGWIHYIVLTLAIISLILHWMYIVSVSNTYDKLRSRFQRNNYDKNYYDRLKRNKNKLKQRNKRYERCLSNVSNQKIYDSYDVKQQNGKAAGGIDHAQIAVKWKYLTLNEKLQLFSPWCIVIMASN